MDKYKLLLVDDHPHFVKALEFMLLNYFEDRIESIDIARNGQECLNLLNEKYFDIVFMDVDMPIMNGVDATKEALNHCRNLIVIALSFHAEMKYIVKMIEAGARNYIIKEEINKDILEKYLCN